MKKRKLHIELQDKMRDDIMYLEHLIVKTIDSIWSDEETIKKYKKIMSLDIDERRLYLTYCILDENYNKTARYFDISRKVVSQVINEIKNKLNLEK